MSQAVEVEPCGGNCRECALLYSRGEQKFQSWKRSSPVPFRRPQTVTTNIVRTFLVVCPGTDWASHFRVAAGRYSAILVAYPSWQPWFPPSF